MNISPKSFLIPTTDDSNGVNQTKSIKLLQLTDTHLFADESGALLSLNTAASFEAVVKEIVNQSVEFDFILATGDISQDHSIASYQRFAQTIQPLKKPCFWLPGNHDFQINMKQVFPSQQIQKSSYFQLPDFQYNDSQDHSSQCNDSHDNISSIEAVWQVILLDSQVEGVPHGYLSSQQLAFLEQKLSCNPQLHSLVLLHHHPISIDSTWLDQHCLHNAEAFWQIIDKYKNVKAILCGHVHQDLDRLYHGVRVLASPSTCVQFKPSSNEFALDELSPGWREIELFADGCLLTQVRRLDGEQFLPDFNAKGY